MNYGMIWIKISAILVGVGITVLSLLPPTSGVEIHVNDKIGHFVAYAVWMINIGLLVSTKHYWKIIVAILVYSGIMEFFQSFIPGREVSFYDMMANTIGAIIGTGILLLFKQQLLKVLSIMKLVKSSS